MESNTEAKNPKQVKLLQDEMSAQYQKIKDQTGIVEALNASDTDSQNDKIFKELRPNAKHTFKEDMKRQAAFARKKQLTKSKYVI